MMNRQHLLQQFNAARLAAVPLLAIRSADQYATMRFLARDAPETFTLASWDAARGIQSLNKSTVKVLEQLEISGNDTIGFAEAMVAAQKLPKKALLFVHNASTMLQSQDPIAIAQNVQALANLRDDYKTTHRMAVLLGPDFVPPASLTQDVVVFNDPLPGPDELETVVRKLFSNARRSDGKPVPMPSDEDIARAVDALSGLSVFSADQRMALSMTENGIDHDSLREHKRTAIELNKGVTVYRGGETFSDIVGHDQLKRHLSNKKRARMRIRLVVVIDEIDKVFANVEGDTTNVRIDQVRTFLTDMENNEWSGFIAAGVAGAGKTLIAKALGNELGAMTLMLDLSGLMSKFVGESEGALRVLMETIKALSGYQKGGVYVIATSNAASVMRPELQRRFTDGIWMFDLMTDAEQEAAWKFYVGKYELTKAQTIGREKIDDRGWTGAEIRNCCRMAWDTNCTLVEASQFVVSMAQSRPEEIVRLRRTASGRFLDTTKPGTYQYDDGKATQPLMERVERVVELPPSVIGMKES